MGQPLKRKKYVFQSQFEIHADNQEIAYQFLARALEDMLNRGENSNVGYFGTQFIEERNA